MDLKRFGKLRFLLLELGAIGIGVPPKCSASLWLPSKFPKQRSTNMYVRMGELGLPKSCFPVVFPSQPAMCLCFYQGAALGHIAGVPQSHAALVHGEAWVRLRRNRFGGRREFWAAPYYGWC